MDCYYYGVFTRRTPGAVHSRGDWCSCKSSERQRSCVVWGWEKPTQIASVKQAWEEIATIVSSAGIPRTSHQCRKRYNDIRRRGKSKLASINRARRVTGGGSASTQDLTPAEDIAASTLTAESVEGFGGFEIGTQSETQAVQPQGTQIHIQGFLWKYFNRYLHEKTFNAATRLYSFAGKTLASRAVRTGHLRREQRNHQGPDPLHAVAALLDRRTTPSCSSANRIWNAERSCLGCGKVWMAVLTGWRLCCGSRAHLLKPERIACSHGLCPSSAPPTILLCLFLLPPLHLHPPVPPGAHRAIAIPPETLRCPIRRGARRKTTRWREKEINFFCLKYFNLISICIFFSILFAIDFSFDKIQRNFTNKYFWRCFGTRALWITSMLFFACSITLDRE